MKAYKIFRWFLRASALTTVMFVMQACYGSPYMPDIPEEEPTEEEMMNAQGPVCDSLVRVE